MKYGKKTVASLFSLIDASLKGILLLVTMKFLLLMIYLQENYKLEGSSQFHEYELRLHGFSIPAEAIIDEVSDRSLIYILYFVISRIIFSCRCWWMAMSFVW